MEYLIFGSVIIIVGFLVFHLLKRKKSQVEIEQFRSEWGKPKSKFKTNSFNFISIRMYASVVKENFHRITDQTIEDIDFHRLFKFIDRTTSRVGQQYLFKKVIEPTSKVEDQSDGCMD